MLAGLFTAGRTHAQSREVQANVPFHFIVGNKQLPAGTYRLQMTTDHILLIQNRDKNAAVMSMLLAPSGKAEADNKLVFHKYGDTYFLSQVRCTQVDVNGAIPESKLERHADEQTASVQPESTVLVALGN
jgi:hypothetical protein